MPNSWMRVLKHFLANGMHVMRTLSLPGKQAFLGRMNAFDRHRHTAQKPASLRSPFSYRHVWDTIETDQTVGFPEKITVLRKPCTTAPHGQKTTSPLYLSSELAEHLPAGG